MNIQGGFYSGPKFTCRRQLEPKEWDSKWAQGVVGNFQLLEKGRILKYLELDLAET